MMTINQNDLYTGVYKKRLCIVCRATGRRGRDGRVANREHAHERSARVEVLSISTLPSQIESERKARVICSRASLRAREQITSALSQTRDPPSQSGSTFVESFTLEGSDRASFTAYLLLL